MANKNEFKNLIIVGSAPIEIDYSELVETADIVVRFNDCKNIGGSSGDKTDILFVNNTGGPARRYINEQPFSRKSCCQSAVIWFVRDSLVHHRHLEKVKTYFPTYPASELDDLTDKIIDSNQLQDRQTFRVSAAFNEEIFNRLSHLSSAPFIMPSTGIIGLVHVIANPAFANHRIHVIGFGFKGWKGHPWPAEKSLIERYVLEKRLSIYPNVAPPHNGNIGRLIRNILKWAVLF